MKNILLLAVSFFVVSCSFANKNDSYSELRTNPIMPFAVLGGVTYFIIEGSLKDTTAMSEEREKSQKFYYTREMNCKNNQFVDRKINFDNLNFVYGVENNYISQYQSKSDLLTDLNKANKAQTMRMCENVYKNEIFKNKCNSILKQQVGIVTGDWEITGGFEVNDKYYFNLKQNNIYAIAEKNEIEPFLYTQKKNNKTLTAIYKEVYEDNDKYKRICSK